MPRFPIRRSTRRFTALLLSALLLSACGDSGPGTRTDDGISPPDDGALQEAARAVLENARSAGLIDGYALEIGTADAVFARIAAGDVRSIDTPVLIASAGKPVSAAVILSLVNDGRLLSNPLNLLNPDRLTLDDPIATWLGNSPAGNTQAAQVVTLRQLLNHTSGLTTTDCVDGPDRRNFTLMECATQVLEAGTEFEPGSAFAYGGGSYHVAGAVAEAFTGQPWQELVNQRIADPLDVSLPYFPMENPRVAGGILTSMADLGIFLRANLARDTSLLRAADYTMMRNSQVPDTGDKLPAVTAIGYSFGWWLEDPAELPDGTAGPELTAPGFLGTVPWVDDDRGYYAVLLLRQSGYIRGLALMRALRAEILDKLS